MTTNDLFQNAPIEHPFSEDGAVASPAEERLTLTAHRLAIRFTEDTDLPARYRKLSDPARKIRKVKEDSEVEKRFKANVEAWAHLIETMLAKIEESQAWRFINLVPHILGTMNKVTDNKDFCDFVDYMILRRDKEQCGPDELGGLALLSVAFQREVEKRIQT
jgi:hypothetical protein